MLENEQEVRKNDTSGIFELINVINQYRELFQSED